jgi:hypothetical protein
VAGVVHIPDAGAADNNLRFPSQSHHVAQAAAAAAAAVSVVAVVAVAMTVVVAAAACRSSAAWHGRSAVVARSHKGVEVARTQACGAEPAVSLLVRRRTVVATEPRAETAKKRVAHMDW